MLLFIILLHHLAILYRDFNTSHVTVYLSFISPMSQITPISIHPMLLFIMQEAYKDFKNFIFQYIPCYCLSRRRIFWSMRKEISIQPILLFIDKTIRELCTHVIFQYIPCYCLSVQELCLLVYVGISIHPMLLFICYFLTIQRTSNIISIHPMLLFIRTQ